MVPKKITVKYGGVDEKGLGYTNELNFQTERDADIFISEMKKYMMGVKYLTKIITWGYKGIDNNES